MGGVIVVLLAVLAVAVGWAGDIVFIVSKDSDIKGITLSELRKIYLREKEFFGGQYAVPVNLPAGSPIRKVVERKVLRMGNEELELYWNRKYLDGTEPPVVLSSEKAVKEFVRKVKGAIGYVDEDNLEEDLKVIYRLKK